MRQGQFGADFAALRNRLIKQQLAGEKPELATAEWSGQSVPRLDAMTTVAEIALAAAKSEAEKKTVQESLDAAQAELLAAA